MVQKIESLHEAFDTVDTIIDSILTDAFKTISDRSETIYDHVMQSDVETLKSDVVKSYESKEGQKDLDLMVEVNVTSCWTDDGYQSLPNLSDVGIKDSSLSNSSKQGEGDQRVLMRESPAFTRLNQETDYQLPRKSSNSSLCTDDTSEIIQYLQNEINDLSFDSIVLSENDEREYISAKSFIDNNMKASFLVCDTNYDDPSSLVVDDETNEGCKNRNDPNESNIANTLPQSQKFCQYNNVQYFPYNILPQNYCELVDDSYKQYALLDDEEGQKLLSDNSEELLTIVGDEETTSQEYVVSSRFNATPSSINISTQSPRPSTSKDIACSAEVGHMDPKNKQMNWEEHNEVQVKVIVPSEEPEEEKGIEDQWDDMVKTRQYWSNVGLMQERIIDRKYLGPTVHTGGIESIPVVHIVEENSLRKSSNDLLWMSQSRSLERSTTLDKRPQSALESGQLRFLTLRKKEESPKKKKLMARLASSFTNLFRSKKKSAKRNCSTLAENDQR